MALPWITGLGIQAAGGGGQGIMGSGVTALPTSLLPGRHNPPRATGVSCPISLWPSSPALMLVLPC